MLQLFAFVSIKKFYLQVDDSVTFDNQDFFIVFFLAVIFLDSCYLQHMLCCFVIFVCADFVSDLFLFCPFILFYSVDKKIIPRVANDVKLISGGKILENNKTIAQCRSPFGELPAGVITMHVVVQPSLTKIKTGKLDLVYLDLVTSSWKLWNYRVFSYSLKSNYIYMKFHAIWWIA